MVHKKYIIAIYWLSIGVLFSCKKNGVNTEILPAGDTSQTKVIVLCEGNYSWSNADFDIYYPKTGKVVSSVFKTQNNGKALGDVLQSAFFADSLLWFVLNNSGKIVAVDLLDFTYKKQLTGLQSPRYVSHLSNKFWISDIYANKISFSNTAKSAVEGSITCKGWTEQMISFGSHLYVSNLRYGLFKINPQSAQIVDSVQLQRGAQWMAMDKNEKLWVLTSDSGKSALYRLNLLTNNIEKQFTIPGTAGAMKLTMSKNRDTIVFLSEGVWCHAIDNPSLPASACFKMLGSNLYGIGCDPWTGEIYVANAKDYVSKGEVFKINSRGQLLSQFTCGIIPNGFLFYR